MAMMSRASFVSSDPNQMKHSADMTSSNTSVDSASSDTGRNKFSTPTREAQSLHQTTKKDRHFPSSRDARRDSSFSALAPEYRKQAKPQTLAKGTVPADQPDGGDKVGC